MKVAVFTDTFLPTVNGVVSSVLNYSNELSKRGHQVLLVAPKHPGLDGKKAELGKNIDLVLVNSLNGRLYPNLRIGFPTKSLLGKYKSFDPEIVHTFTPGILGLTGLMFAKESNKSVVSSHLTNFGDPHALKILGLRGLNLTLFMQKGVVWFLIKFLNRHDLILVPTQDTREELVEKNIRVKVELLKLPVPVQRLIEAKKEGLRKRKLLGIKRSIVYVGRLSGEKKVDQVIRVFSKLKKEFFDLKLVLVGDGPKRKELMNLAIELRVMDSIVWTGEMSYEELISSGVFYWGDVFLSFSDFETQGLTFVEAMVCGLLVVSTGVRGAGEVVQGGKVGVVVENQTVATNVLKDYFNNPRDFQEKIKKARIVVKEYEVGCLVDELENYYKKVLKNEK